MKIVLCTLAINEWYREIVKYAVRNIKDYADRHGFEFALQTEQDTTLYDGKRDCPWYKIAFIKKIMTENNPDFVIWIDADCQIMKPEINIASLINKYMNGKDLLLGALGVEHNEEMNTGVMILRNTEFCRNLLDRIWNHNPSDPNFHEQSALIDIYRMDEEVRQKVKVLNYSLKSELYNYWREYYPGKVFILHSARCSNDRESFIYMMDMYNIHKLDEETDEQYKKRMQYLMTDASRKDIDCWISNKYVPRIPSVRNTPGWR